MSTPAQTLHTLARLDPDFPAFAAALPPEVLQAAALPPDGLAADVVALLRAERPELLVWLEAPPAATPREKFDLVGTLATAGGTLAIILFFLRSYIKIECTPEGIHFLFEYKPMDNDLLKKVLDTLAKYRLSGGE